MHLLSMTAAGALVEIATGDTPALLDETPAKAASMSDATYAQVFDDYLDPMGISGYPILTKLRQVRDATLRQCDALVARHYTQQTLVDNAGLEETTLTAAQFLDLCEYMQALRDAPQTFMSGTPAAPAAFTWPTAPAWLEA